MAESSFFLPKVDIQLSYPLGYHDTDKLMSNLHFLLDVGEHGVDFLVGLEERGFLLVFPFEHYVVSVQLQGWLDLVLLIAVDLRGGLILGG